MATSWNTTGVYPCIGQVPSTGYSSVSGTPAGAYYGPRLVFAPHNAQVPRPAPGQKSFGIPHERMQMHPGARRGCVPPQKLPQSVSWGDGPQFRCLPGAGRVPARTKWQPPASRAPRARWLHSNLAVDFNDMAKWQAGRHGRWIPQLQEELEQRIEAQRAAEALVASGGFEDEPVHEHPPEVREPETFPDTAPPVAAEGEGVGEGVVAEAETTPVEAPAGVAEESGHEVNLDGAENLEAEIARLNAEKPITQLSIMKNNLSRVPDCVLKMQTLTSLNIQENQIESINPVCNAMPWLEELDLSDNPITTLGNIHKLTNLKALSAYKLKNLKEVPEVMFTECTKLEQLNLYNNAISSLPLALQNLTNLQELNLASNKILQLRDGTFDGMVSLRRLALFWNRIIKLPSLQNLTSLEELQMNSNSLQEMPPTGLYPNLTSINFSKNALQELPDTMFSAEAMPVLESLEMGNNQLMFVPEGMGQLPALTKLVLSSNKLSSLPDSLYQSQTLTFLDIGHNRFEKIPEAIANWAPRMVAFFIPNNEMRTLPKALLLFGNLKRFNVRSCPLDKKDTTTAEVLKGMEEVTERNGGMFIS
eukprot:NODE_796_length_1860_cov_68.634737_g743_i0.p1 GENE.NODE_796_length_1860_cov_68.634737_g743_i0~~NODE_796_length_1860_cov_68.634737_g743_i0.p1  ORF type:complete len:590 (-),score=169.45 NODE_796_length_1860_cov_68.634737_g743_i0:60-1829(-)